MTKRVLFLRSNWRADVSGDRGCFSVRLIGYPGPGGRQNAPSTRLEQARKYLLESICQSANQPESKGNRPSFLSIAFRVRTFDVLAFESHLAEYDLPDQVIEAYTMTFYHGGKFVLVSPPSATSKS